VRPGADYEQSDDQDGEHEDPVDRVRSILSEAQELGDRHPDEQPADEEVDAEEDPGDDRGRAPVQRRAEEPVAASQQRSGNEDRREQIRERAAGSAPAHGATLAISFSDLAFRRDRATGQP
jgi:hypothetical protein